MLRVDHGTDRSGRATLNGNPIEMLVHGNGISHDLLRGAVIPAADDFHGFPISARFFQDFLNAFVTIAIDGCSGNAAHFKQLALVARHILDKPVAPQSRQGPSDRHSH